MPLSISNFLGCSIIYSISCNYQWLTNEAISLDCRRYFGHKPTIRPNAKKLYRLFSARNNMTWEEFASSVRTFQRGFMGQPKEVRPGRGAFHENPASCICENSGAKTKMDSVQKEPGKGSSPIKRDVDLAVEDQDMNDDANWSDPEDEDDLTREQGNNLYNETSQDYDTLFSEEPELDELLSD